MKRFFKRVEEVNRRAGTLFAMAIYKATTGPDDAYMALVPHRTLAELDIGIRENAAYDQALGEDGAKELKQLRASGFLSAEVHLFVVNPKMSYVSEQVAASDPEFWKGTAVTQAGMPAAPTMAVEKS
jgi:hypothetical protein